MAKGMETDLVLLKQIRERDELAFGQLYERYNRSLLGKCHARVGDATKAEDIVQNIWVEVWERPHRIKVNEEGSAEGFLSSYLFFRIMDHFRQESKDVIALVNSVSLEYVGEELSYSHVSEELDIKDLEEVIAEVLDQLPGRQTEMIMMLHRDGFTVRETAEKLHLNERTVRAHAKQSLELLRREMEPELKRVKRFKVLKDSSQHIILIVLLIDQLL